MRAVIWRAVSSEEQAGDDKISLAYQEQLGREHAAKHGMRVTEVITSDDSRSIVRIDKAIANPRLGYGRLAELIEQRALDVLLFFDASRLGRNRGLVSTLQEMCYEAGVILYDMSAPPPNVSAPNVRSGAATTASLTRRTC